MTPEEFLQFKVDTEVKAVVLGITKQFDHAKLAILSLYLQQPGMKFFVTNEDRVYSAGRNRSACGTRFIPDIGSLLKSVETASGCNPAIRIGKPEVYAFQAIIRDHFENEPPNLSDFLMIGDNVESDIQFAKNNGIDSVLVYTGVTNKESKISL